MCVGVRPKLVPLHIVHKIVRAGCPRKLQCHESNLCSIYMHNTYTRQVHHAASAVPARRAMYQNTHRSVQYLVERRHCTVVLDGHFVGNFAVLWSRQSPQFRLNTLYMRTMWTQPQEGTLNSQNHLLSIQFPYTCSTCEVRKTAQGSFTNFNH